MSTNPVTLSLSLSPSLRSAGGSCSAPVLHRCSASDYSSHVTLRNVPRSARCASLLEEPVRPFARSLARPFFLLSHCCLVSTYAEKETSLPLPPSAAASNLPSLFFSPLPLACALPVKRFLFTGELSSNSSETSGCRSSRRSARLLCLSCHCRLLWKAVESQSSCFSR